jgi:predicted Zn-dependent peptidase
VSIYGRVRSESLSETSPGKDGVDQVLDRLFNYGTATQDRLAYQRVLDEIGADECAGASFSVVVLRSHLERALQLLADNELHPAFRGEDFDLVRRQVAAQVAGELDSPGYLTRCALLRAIYPKGDPKLRQATPKTVMGLSISDAQEYYDRVFRPDMTTSRTRTVYVVEYACDPNNVSRARGIVERDLRAMQTEPVSAPELKQAKALLMTETALGEASVSAIAGGLLDRATIGLPLDEPTLTAHRYLALNAEQVKDAFARRLRLKDLAQVTQGPPQ